MAEKVQIQAKTDVESASNAKELQQKRRMRKLAIVTAFVVFLTVIILVFSQTVMRVKTPKLRIRSIDIEDLTVSRTANSNLENDVRSGFLTLTGQSKLSGKVHLMKVFKKKKTAEMNCTITVNLENKVVQDLKCK
ncbi:hypothetical protein TIFTF001_013694 [Ficus carica]|uniref:Late embryogenesis abundant protein LEA-2 subgroup domain-containing protein n=1 Tax=Ficus carica TaxID=3494 RepID=A0AA87ZVF8_FICCA|nr:hypothetical protein TIFTF001_013694 [Ficus carica]